MANEKYIKELGKMRRPIPGSSLTNDPKNPLPFEGPPEFTKKKDALESLFENMISEENYPLMMKALMEGTPVMDMTQVLLFEGFRQGKWNPDLLLMLIEPTAYLIMALAERGGIDFIVDGEPPDEDDDTVLEEKFERLAKKVGNKPKAGVLPKEITKQIDELPVESLLAKPKEAPVQTEASAPPVDESLIQKPEIPEEVMI
jgi:hypothetical protein